MSQDINSVIINGIENEILLKDYLEKVNSESGIRFFYDDKLLENLYLKKSDNGKLFITYLTDDLAQKGISFITYKKKNFVLIDRNKLSMSGNGNGSDKYRSENNYSVVDVGDPMLAGKYRSAIMKGYVRSGETGEPLPGAIIYVEDRNFSVVTDFMGKYSIEMPVGKHKLNVSYVGYENSDFAINLLSPGVFDAEIFESTIAIDQVIVSGQSEKNVASTEMSIIRLDGKSLKTIPVLMGEPDLLRSLTLMPGVKSSGDMASGLNIRGGNSDQNLILIDDAPIYNSSHLLGMYSVVDTRIINNLELYKGGAPAQFGGRASSVMDIALKEGNFKKTEGDGAIGLFSSKLTLQGPLVKDKVSILIGGRTTYSDWILKRIPDVDIRKSSANFYDLNAKLSFILSRNDRINLFTYISNDKLNLAGKNEYQYGNKLASLKWSHIFNDKLTASLTGYFSNFQNKTTDMENETESYQISTGIKQFGTKLRFLYLLGSKQTIETGLEANKYTFFSGEKQPYGKESATKATDMGSEHSIEYAGYLQDKIDVNGQLSIMLGLRYAYYILQGPTQIDLYKEGEYPTINSLVGTKEISSGQEVTHYGGFEPRFNIKYNLDLNSAIKLGYNRNYQYLHILSNSTVITPTDIWKSSDLYIKPAQGDQLMFGYFRNFKGGAYETSLEVYYKKVQNVLEYKNGAILLLNDTLERSVLSGDMDAYGVELLLRKNSGRLSGWISYTYSRSFIKTSNAPQADLINNGERYPANYDKPNDLSLVANYKLSRRFTISSTFTYSTGRPATYPELSYNIYGNILIRYSDRNKYRLEDYHRLDLSITWDTSLKKRKKIYSSWVLSVYNVYGRNNVYSTFYKKDIPSKKNNYQQYALYEMSIIGSPIPSLTYNLRF